MPDTLPTLDITFDSETKTLSVSSDLTFSTVSQIFQETTVFFNGIESLNINLESIQVCDSASLSLLLAWMRRARAQRLTLVFIGMPAKMRDLARVSGIDAILPTQQK